MVETQNQRNIADSNMYTNVPGYMNKN